MIMDLSTLPSSLFYLVVFFLSLGCIVSFLISMKRRRKMNLVRNDYKGYLSKQKRKFARYLAKHPMDDSKIEKITSMPVMKLIEELRSKKLDHNVVLLAFQHKAFRVNEKLNCVTEFLFPNFADIRLDGPLAGLPVSIKESFFVKNMVNCVGLVAMIEMERPKEDNVLVQVIKQMGGVPFCRTNTPQAAMSFQSENPVYGATLNPHDTTRSPGGSSSGEGALIAARGSPLGLGTDIGGSIRVPAAWCGIVGFKPTCERLSCHGLSPIADQILVGVSSGPLARDVDTAIELMRLLTSSSFHRQLDRSIPHLPWREECFTGIQRRLRIGVLTFNGVFQASTPLLNVVKDVERALTANGHYCIPFQLPVNGKVLFKYYLKFILSDGGKTFLDFLKVDEIDDSLKELYLAGSLPHWLIRCLKPFYKYMLHDEDTEMTLKPIMGYKNVYSMWKDHFNFVQLRHQIEAYWNEMKFDALLCPACGCLPAFIKGSKPYLGAASYTSLFNLLNYPAGIVPIRTVKHSDLVFFPSRSDSLWHKNAAEFERNSLNLPLAVQVATLPFQDEECLFVMKVIENIVKQSF